MCDQLMVSHGSKFYTCRLLKWRLMGLRGWTWRKIRMISFCMVEVFLMRMEFRVYGSHQLFVWRGDRVGVKIRWSQFECCPSDQWRCFVRDAWKLVMVIRSAFAAMRASVRSVLVNTWRVSVRALVCRLYDSVHHYEHCINLTLDTLGDGLDAQSLCRKLDASLTWPNSNEFHRTQRRRGKLRHRMPFRYWQTLMMAS